MSNESENTLLFAVEGVLIPGLLIFLVGWLIGVGLKVLLFKFF
jgi:hypothetical protein